MLNFVTRSTLKYFDLWLIDGLSISIDCTRKTSLIICNYISLALIHYMRSLPTKYFHSL